MLFELFLSKVSFKPSFFHLNSEESFGDLSVTDYLDKIERIKFKYDKTIVEKLNNREMKNKLLKLMKEVEIDVIHLECDTVNDQVIVYASSFDETDKVRLLIKKFINETFNKTFAKESNNKSIFIFNFL